MQNNTIHHIASFQLELTGSLDPIQSHLMPVARNLVKFKPIARGPQRPRREFSSQHTNQIRMRWRSGQLVSSLTQELEDESQIWTGRKRKRKLSLMLQVRQIPLEQEEIRLNEFRQVGRRLRQISEQFEAQRRLMKTSGHQTGADSREEDTNQIIRWGLSRLLDWFLRKIALFD